jgi:predicted DNA-binding protein
MWCMCVYMKRTNIYLREDHQKKLKVLSEKTGAPVSALIRKAIEEYLKKK